MVKQTLIILSPGFPENEADTTCLPAQQLLVRSLNSLFPSVEIIILAFQYPFNPLPYRWFGNQVIPFNGQNRGNIHRVHIWTRVWLALSRLRKKHNITGLLSFWSTECALVGKYFARLHRYPHYCWILGQDAKSNNVFVPLIRPKPDELVAMSAFLAKEFYKNHRVLPAHIIPNGVATGMYKTAITERDIDILGAGSLIPLKQYDVFISLVAVIKQHSPGLKVVICGKGIEKNALTALIKEYGLESTISLVGEKPHQEVIHLMQRAKILLHTSRYEGFSTVCLEALYAGAHVISFCNPVTEKIDHWHIVSTRDDMLQKTLEILLGDHTEYKPVLVSTMDESARSMMRLFGI